MISLQHILDDVFALFVWHKQTTARPKKGGKRKDQPMTGRLSLRPPIWLVKEHYDQIYVNSDVYQFLELALDEQSLNPFSYVFSLFPFVVVHVSVRKAAIDEVHASLRRRLAGLEEEKQAIVRRGIIGHAFLDYEIMRTKRSLAALGAKQDLFSISAMVVTKGVQHHRNVARLEALFNVQVVPLYFRQLRALQRLLFPDQRREGGKASLLSEIQSANTFPAFARMEPEGILIGEDVETHVLVFEDFFKYENYNTVILAKSGAGKTHLATCLMKRMLFQGIHIIIIDPEDEYNGAVQALHGKVCQYVEDIPIDAPLMSFQAKHKDLRALLQQIDDFCLERGGKNMIFIDEAHKVMDDANVAPLLRDIAKRGRKYGVGICVVTQDVLDCVQNKWAKAIISNATHKFLLKQEKINIPLLETMFPIQEDADFLLHAAIGDGVYIRGEKYSRVHFLDL